MRKAYQKVLIDLQITIVMGKVCCSVERCETLLVTLIYFCPVVEKVVNLRSTRIDICLKRRSEREKAKVNHCPQLLTISSCLYVVAKCKGAPAPLSWVMK